MPKIDQVRVLNLQPRGPSSNRNWKQTKWLESNKRKRCISQGGESRDFAPWADPESQVLSLQGKRSTVWRTRWRVEEEGVAEAWVSEEHGCYQKTWCPWSARSSCSEKTAVLVLQNLSVCIWAFGTLYQLSQPQSPLCSSLQVGMLMHHREQENLPVSLCNGQGECSW